MVSILTGIYVGRRTSVSQTMIDRRFDAYSKILDCMQNAYSHASLLADKHRKEGTLANVGIDGTVLREVRGSALSIIDLVRRNILFIDRHDAITVFRHAYAIACFATREGGVIEHPYQTVDEIRIKHIPGFDLYIAILWYEAATDAFRRSFQTRLKAIRFPTASKEDEDAAL